MKKIFLIIFSVFFLFFGMFSWVSATGTYSVEVSEKVYGANCTKLVAKEGSNSGVVTYRCDIEPGMGTFMKMMSGIIKFLTALGALAWVLFIVINGIQLSMWWLDSSAKEDAKKWIGKAISGLIFLLLSGVILSMIAPWIYK